MTDDDTSSSVSGPTMYTPTHTTPSVCAATPAFSIDDDIGTAPEPGGTYMIRDITTNQALTLSAGHLTLQLTTTTTTPSGGQRWECVEHENWLGFRESVSHKYLGRDGGGGYVARADRFDSWEKFSLRHLKGGGYHLMSVHWYTLFRMGVERGSGRLREGVGAGEGVRWEFVEV